MHANTSEKYCFYLERVKKVPILNVRGYHWILIIKDKKKFRLNEQDFFSNNENYLEVFDKNK